MNRLLLLLAFLVATPVAAQEPPAPEAAPEQQSSATDPVAALFTRAQEVGGRTLEADFSMAMQLPMQGLNVEMTATMVVADPRHSVLDGAQMLTATNDLTKAAYGDAVTMTMRIVGDGDYLWTETNGPDILGGHRVQRVSYSVLESMQEEIAKAQGLGAMNSVGDLGSMLPMFQRGFDLRVEKEETIGGRATVIVSGFVEDASLLNLQLREFFTVGDETIELYFDKASGLAIGVIVSSGDSVSFSIQLQNLRLPDKVDMEQFQYSPPEGVLLNDMDAMFGAAAGG